MDYQSDLPTVGWTGEYPQGALASHENGPDAGVTESRGTWEGPSEYPYGSGVSVFGIGMMAPVICRDGFEGVCE